MIGYMKRGPQRVGYSSPAPFRCDLTGALVTTDGHARYQEAVLNGNVWIGSNALGTPVTPAAGLSATTPALTLYNPINSAVNLVLWEFQCLNTTVQGAQSGALLAYNLPAITGVIKSPFTVTNAQVTNALLSLGFAQSVTATQNQGAWGQCYAVCTLIAAPVAFRYSMVFNYGSSVAATSTVCIDHIDGAVVIPPGIAVSAQFVAATPVVCSFAWEEVPVNS